MSNNFDFNLRRDHKKKEICYERRDYESVDEKSVSYIGFFPKNDEKKNLVLKGLTLYARAWRIRHVLPKFRF